MRPALLVVGYAATALLAGGAGWTGGSSQGATGARVHKGSPIDVVRAAQARSPYGAHLKWMDAKEAARFQALRDRGYRFCLDQKKGDRQCELGQDDAIQLIALLPIMLRDQRDANPSTLDRKAAALAINPALITGGERYCRAIFPDGDASDVRILGACLNNLIDGGFVVPLPVP